MSRGGRCQRFASVAAIIVFAVTDTNTQIARPPAVGGSRPHAAGARHRQSRDAAAHRRTAERQLEHLAEDRRGVEEAVRAVGAAAGLPALRERFKVKTEADDRQRRAGLSGDARGSPAREPQPAARAHSRRLLRPAAAARRRRPRPSTWRVRPLQGALRRLPPAARVPLSRPRSTTAWRCGRAP